MDKQTIMEDLSSRLKLDQYQFRIKAIMSESDELDDRIKQEVRDLITEMRDQVLVRVSEVQGRIAAVGGVEPPWGPFWVSRLVSDFNQIIVIASQKFKKNLGEYTIKSYEIGRGMADKGLEFALPGVDLSDPELAKQIPKMDINGVKLAASFPGDLITNMEEKQLAAITKEVSVAVSLGKSPGELMSKLAVSIDKGPWLETKYRAEVIARTETARTQELGRSSRDKQIKNAFPGLKLYQQWLTYPILKWPCKKCAQFDGNIYDENGKLFMKAPGKSNEDLPGLPYHPNCFTGDTLVSSLNDIEAIFRRIYVGEIIEFFIGPGFNKICSITPNHPVLTNRGWIIASEVNEGDYLVNGSFFENSSRSFSKINIQDPYSMFKEKFSSYSLLPYFRTHRAIGATPQFHGDGGTEDVDIISSKTHLWETIDSSVLKPVEHIVLPYCNHRESVLSSDRGISHSRFGSGSPSSIASLFERHLRKTDDICFGASSDMGICSDQNSSNNCSRYLEFTRNSQLGHPTCVEFSKFQVTRINRLSFSGHVYNLQTSSGLYSIGDKNTHSGFLALNCRCTLIPWIPNISKDPITPKEKTAEEQKEKLLSKQQVNASKVAWDDDLKIWIITLPDKTRRTMNIGKRSSDEELQSQALKIVRGAGYQKVHNVILIEHPRQMVGPSYERKMRAMNRSLGM